MLFSIVMGASAYICGLFSGCICSYLYINYDNIHDKLQEDAIVLSYKTIQLYTNIKENSIVKKINKTSQWLYMNIIHFLYNTVIEPPGSFWIYSCSLDSLEKKTVPLYDSLLNGREANDFKKHKYILNEKYNELTEHSMNEFCESSINYNKSFFLTDAQLIIIKVVDNYIIRRAENNNPLVIKKSKYGFLSVEYIHPKQKEPIVLNINKNMCMEGNELFTPEFVLRTLIYQNVDYYFDLDYKIRIMDNKINMFELNSSQYIEFTDNSYLSKLS
jgi:hypothetical protein